MKNKIRLLSISKSEHRSEYSFSKEQKLFEIIRNILYNLGFEDEQPSGDIKTWWRPTDEGGLIIPNKEDKIKEYNEIIQNAYNKKYSIEIVFFSKKVNLIFNYKKDKQQEIAKIINKFILDKEIKKLKK